MPLFSPATAAAMAEKSRAARRANAAAQTAELARLRALVADLTAANAALQTVTAARPDGDYTADRLERVRARLDSLDDALAKEKDPLSIERLARATAALSQQEFALAGRPLPGSLRPSAAAARKAAGIDYGQMQPAKPVPISQPLSAPSVAPAPQAKRASQDMASMPRPNPFARAG